MSVRTVYKDYKSSTAKEIEDAEDPKSYLYWLQPDNLMLVAGWARTGYSIGDIARMMGVSNNVFRRWYDKYPKFRRAVKTNKDVVDYKVENALLKSALGYTAKESRVLVTMRHGKVVETQRETLTRDIAPQIGAIRMWLLNRQPEVWKNENKMSMDDLLEDSKIHISVTRASKGNNLDTTSESVPEKDVADKDIEIRSSTKKEQREYIKKKREEARKRQKHDVATPRTRSSFSSRKLKSEELDYWPEDWEDA
jgi:hypothetical protein|nr:MAG TPA: terminase small subunit [Caudoviricetes sp.]